MKQITNSRKTSYHKNSSSFCSCIRKLSCTRRLPPIVDTELASCRHNLLLLLMQWENINKDKYGNTLVRCLWQQQREDISFNLAVILGILKRYRTHPNQFNKINQWWTYVPQALQQFMIIYGAVFIHSPFAAHKGHWVGSLSTQVAAIVDPVEIFR